MTRWLGIGLCLSVVLVAAPVRTQAPLERFTAFAVNLANPGRSATSTVEIAITRWSTDAERDNLITSLLEVGPEKLLTTLQKMRKVGYFRTPDSLAYDLHYAHRTPMGDGERIQLITDRPISFWEQASQPRSVNYPFTVIEMHIASNGQGEGKMSLATKITGDAATHSIVLENYNDQPVLLNSVRRQK